MKTLLRGLIEQISQISGATNAPLSDEEWERLADELATAGKSLPAVPTEDFFRANIYADHDWWIR